MSKKLPYYHADWYKDADWDEYYSMLHGPDGFACCLTEPEDRNWFRDGSDVVNRLNEQHNAIAALTAERDELRKQLMLVNGYNAGLQQDTKALTSERDELKAVVGKYPTTEDGIPVAPWMTVYGFDADGNICEIVIGDAVPMCDDGDPRGEEWDADDWYFGNTAGVFSTEAAAKAASKTNQGATDERN